MYNFSEKPNLIFTASLTTLLVTKFMPLGDSWLKEFHLIKIIYKNGGSFL